MFLAALIRDRQSQSVWVSQIAARVCVLEQINLLNSPHWSQLRDEKLLKRSSFTRILPSSLSLSVTRPRSSLLLTSLISSYLCSQSHWDNCAPIMEKLVGPEMSSSLFLSALREAERRRSTRSATSNLDELPRRRRRRRRKDHRCEASSANQLSLRSFQSSSSLRCSCFLLEYHFNVTLQVFYYSKK